MLFPVVLPQQETVLKAAITANLEPGITSVNLPQIEGDTMNATDMLPADKLSILKGIAAQHNTDPNLILAIGQLETGWGKLGDGRRGMYTGYGSFDSGSDYTKAGFEKQVAGTASKMSAWGIGPGEVTRERLAAGNAGLLPTGIYATDHKWPDKVFSIYKQIVDDSGDIKAADGVVISSDKQESISSGSGSSKKGYVFLGGCMLLTVGILAGVMK